MRRGLRAAVLLAGILTVDCVQADEADTFFGWLVEYKHTNEIQPVVNEQYQEECGSCHFAYQPGLLPARSWEKLLNAQALHDHFGENAELDNETLRVVHDYAIANAADKSYYKRSRKIARATGAGAAPLRITEVSYIRRAHRNLPDTMVKGNKDVKSLGHCDKCHTQAAEGVYDEDTVSIPNFPDWHD
jgi:hypothetical protein